MLGGKNWDEWIEEYSHSHTHPINKFTHKIGIPLIVLSAPLFIAAFFVKSFWVVPVVLFVGGWALQFVGHFFEGKPPEFFKDWRFLFVGVRWWIKKVKSKN